ncbi:MAG: beta-ketoacyl-ACP synthase II [Chloroflexota bacterium]
MSYITRDLLSQRNMLRQRLLELASVNSAEDPTLLEQHIESLLDDIEGGSLEPNPSLAPLHQWNEDQRVVVTGMGVLTPLGIGIDAFWNGIVEGRSGIDKITLCDPGDSPSRIAGEVRDFHPRDYMDAKEARRVSRASQLAVAAAHMAMDDAQLRVDDHNRFDIGVLIGNGSTSPPDTETAAKTLMERGFSRLSPFYIASSLPNMPSCQVAIQMGLMGYNTVTATACAAGSQAIGEAVEIIRRGDARVMLAGGTEAPICQLSLASFSALRALSTHNDEPMRASRPFDAKRDGFVLSEGAGVLVLEQLSHARRRGATIYAEIIGYASTCDAYHVTAPDIDGAGAARAMTRAMTRANISLQQIDYINAHATSTPTGDNVETRAIKRAFSEYAYNIPVSSTKSMIGHLTSAAGAVEAIASILALRYGVIPPTINYEHPDPDCNLDYVPNQARSANVQIVMSNSFGFGGINGVLIFQNPSVT